MRPRIAIPLPTATDAAYNARSWPAYARAVELAGGEPVEIPLNLPTSELLALAHTCHGVCLPGSPADVDPARYAAEIDPATNPADPAREAADYLLLDEASQHAKPVLAICFGVQSLNVWRGGTLLQDLTPLPVNHSAGASVAIAHSAMIAKFSLLSTLLNHTEAPVREDFYRLPVNSSHHQAVSEPGEGLRVSARCPNDGVIEAIENAPEYRSNPHLPPQFVLGLQWHPERSYDLSPTSRALFARLITEATPQTAPNLPQVPA